jgi:hypothetical protein
VGGRRWNHRPLGCALNHPVQDCAPLALARGRRDDNVEAKSRLEASATKGNTAKSKS